MGQGQIRLFVAAYPPEESAREMLDALAALDPAPDPHHRVTPMEQVHLTLQFVGPTAVKELPGVIESVERAASGLGAFSLVPRRLVTFPERGPVRLIAMETDATGELLELQKRMALRLSRRPRRGDRGVTFRPHLTLARFTGMARAERVDSAAALAPFVVRQVLLMKSVLLPAGARHEVVARADLG